jgi:CheY-like chemotaxis protein
LKKPLVLIVEDEQIVAAYLQTLLTRAGFAAPETVATGELAVERARSLHPDAILMDINLAGKMNGVEAANQIAMFSKAPFIFVTAHASFYKNLSIDDCPTEVIDKPFDEKTLLGHLRRFTGTAA